MAICVSEVCDRTSCEIECVDACTRVRGDLLCITLNESDGRVTIDADSCIQCLACLRACPLGALSVPSSEEGSRRSHPPGHETLTERPYEMAQYFTRMSEADTIFARVQYDSDFEFYQKSEFSGAEVMIFKDLPGYGRFEHELSVAAWKLYDSRHSIRRSGIGLDSSGSESGRRLITDPHELTDMVKKAARFFGAADVGIAELDRNWLYTKNRRGEEYEIPESITHAVVMLIEMDYDALSTSPAFTSSAATGLGYSTMAFVELELASFIQRFGYDAIACGNDMALSVPLAIDAGLGQYGRHGLLITKKYGPRVRIAKVLTDMPLIADSPDMGFCQSVIRFCETCEKCATNCPSQSIPYGKERTWTGSTRSNNPGIKKWYVDVEHCYGFWTENGSECSNCIRSCPYNKKDGALHRSVVWVVQHMPWMNRVVVRMDDLLGYGKQKDGSKFWKPKK